MDHLDPEKYIEEQRAKQQAAEAESVEQDEDSGSAAGLIGILVALLSVLAFVASYLLDSRDEPQQPPASERSEMATDFWGPDSEPTSVDVPAGMFTKVFKFPIEPDQGVDCRFVVEETRPHEDWSPLLSVELGELGRSVSEVQGEEFVRLSVLFQAPDVGRDYKISTWLNEQMHSFTFMRIVDPADEVRLMLGKRSDGDFVYTASEGSGDYGTGTVHRRTIDPRVATVRVVGAKGVIDCETVDI